MTNMNYKRLFVPNSLIFITAVTKDRKKILIEHIESLRNAFKATKQKYSFDVIAIIVNEDHFHMIIKPEDIKSYPKIIGNIKSTFTKMSKIAYSLNNNGEADVWQRRYWEHTIVNEEDLYKHLDYIHYNSMKHYGIAPKNWNFSSFGKFVKNGYYANDWCNFDDKYKIKSMNIE